jgi:hypothetical protein
MDDQELRNKLATSWAFNKFPVQSLRVNSFPLSIEHDVNYPRRISHFDAFTAGWDAARENEYKALLKPDGGGQYTIHANLSGWAEKERDRLKSELERMDQLANEYQERYAEAMGAAEKLAEALQAVLPAVQEATDEVPGVPCSNYTQYYAHFKLC